MDEIFVLPENIKCPPSVLDGSLTLYQEQCNRLVASDIIFQVGQMLELPPVVIYSAQVNMNRFYCRASMATYPLDQVILGCLYIATKTEELPRPLSQVLICFGIAINYRHHQAYILQHDKGVIVDENRRTSINTLNNPGVDSTSTSTSTPSIIPSSPSITNPISSTLTSPTLSKQPIVPSLQRTNTIPSTPISSAPMSPLAPSTPSQPLLDFTILHPDLLSIHNEYYATLSSLLPDIESKIYLILGFAVTVETPLSLLSAWSTVLKLPSSIIRRTFSILCDTGRTLLPLIYRQEVLVAAAIDIACKVENVVLPKLPFLKHSQETHFEQQCQKIMTNEIFSKLQTYVSKSQQKQSKGEEDKKDENDGNKAGVDHIITNPADIADITTTEDCDIDTLNLVSQLNSNIEDLLQYITSETVISDQDASSIVHSSMEILLQYLSKSFQKHSPSPITDSTQTDLEQISWCLPFLPFTRYNDMNISLFTPSQITQSEQEHQSQITNTDTDADAGINTIFKDHEDGQELLSRKRDIHDVTGHSNSITSSLNSNPAPRSTPHTIHHKNKNRIIRALSMFEFHEWTEQERLENVLECISFTYATISGNYKDIAKECVASIYKTRNIQEYIESLKNKDIKNTDLPLPLAIEEKDVSKTDSKMGQVDTRPNMNVKSVNETIASSVLDFHSHDLYLNLPYEWKGELHSLFKLDLSSHIENTHLHNAQNPPQNVLEDEQNGTQQKTSSFATSSSLDYQIYNIHVLSNLSTLHPFPYYASSQYDAMFGIFMDPKITTFYRQKQLQLQS